MSSGKLTIAVECFDCCEVTRINIAFKIKPRISRCSHCGTVFDNASDLIDMFSLYRETYLNVDKSTREDTL